MESGRLQQIEELFHAAMEFERSEQAEFLKGACGTDESLLQAVESLIAYRSRAENFIHTPAIELAARSIALDAAGRVPVTESDATASDGRAVDSRWRPASIGRYRILAVLGEGGMGVVYEAEQEQPRRTVAVKVIKPGWASAELLQRFERESRALARLQHPAIAQIYEGGTADAGFGPQPYFAMELIRGSSLRKYVQEHHLNTGQRLQLMIRICEGVQHAHQRGLIHRDLKPGNILVDETGQPKILDFGVARVTDSDVETTRQTDLGQMVGTLAYMSPEQASGDPLDVDTRSDVYALGVILYELMAGRLPYDLSRNAHEAARTIREEDPAPLSTISRVYRGDIETIVAKALEKDKARRYASASGLAADIQRYLKDEPIAARPPSASYQVRKFARRNKGLVAGVAAVFVVLLGGIVASTWEAARATSERDRATAAEQRTTQERDRAFSLERSASAAEAQARQERNSAITEKQRADAEAATARAVNDFLENGLLAQASASTQARPNTKPDPDLKVRTALDRAAARIEGKFKGQPLVEASIRLTIGKTYKDLGLYADAERHMERAVEIRDRILGDEHPQTLLSMSNLALVYRYEGKYARAESLGNRVLELQRRLLGEEHQDTMASMNNLFDLYRSEGKYTRAESLGNRVLKLQRRVLGQKHPDTLESMNNLALVYSDAANYAAAELLFTEVIEISRRMAGDNHPNTLTPMNNLATLYARQGKFSKAELLFVRVSDVQRQILGEDHPIALITLSNLAMVYLKEGRYEQAEELNTKVLGVRRHVLGEENPSTLTSANNLALSYLAQGKFTQAQPLILSMLDIKRSVLGQEHPNTLTAMYTLALLYLYEGQYSVAEPLLIELLEKQQRVLGQEHPNTLTTINDLARLYQSTGRYAEADPLYVKVLEVRRRMMRAQDPDTLASLASLGGLRIQQQRYADAEPLLSEAVTGYQETTSDSWAPYNSQSLLGASMAGQKKYAEAEPLLLSGYQGMLQREATIPASERLQLERAGQWIVQLYQEWGKPEQAAEWRDKLQGAKIFAAATKP